MIEPSQFNKAPEKVFAESELVALLEIARLSLHDSWHRDNVMGLMDIAEEELEALECKLLAYMLDSE